MASDEWQTMMAEAESKPKHYKDLQVWQKGMLLAKTVYRLTGAFPSEERYGLVAQMRRAAISVPSNIAEGQARHGTREFLLFLSHAAGSLAELETQLLLSQELGFCNAKDSSEVLALVDEVQRMLRAIRRKLTVHSQALATRHSPLVTNG